MNWMPSLDFWLIALVSIAVVTALGVVLWRTGPIKLLRAIRLERRGIRVL